MNDTIRLVLHDLKKHREILNELRTIKKGYRKFDAADMPMPEVGGTLYHEFLVNELTGKGKERFMYKVRHQPSSNYNVKFTADTAKNCIEMEFSVPKYFYAHNVAQTILNTNDADGAISDTSWEHHLEYGFSRLKRYIKTFFKIEFMNCYIDYNCLQLKRLDFCYNQIFNTKQDALTYLDLQKQLRKKHLRENGMMQPYKTGLMYVSKGHSVKIYHKGTEFELKDAKELERMNTKMKQQKFDVPFLQIFADKILRYEITIRPEYMAYLFNQHIFRKKSTQYMAWKKIYNSVRSVEKRLSTGITYGEDLERTLYKVIYDRNKNLIDKQNGMTVFQYLRLYYLRVPINKDFTIDEIIRTLKKFRMQFESLENHRRTFFFSLDFMENLLHKADNETNENKFNTFNKVVFDKTMFKLMGNKLREFIFDMRIEERKPTDYYINEIHQHNKRIDKERKATKDLPTYLKNKIDTKIDVGKLGMIIIFLEKRNLIDLQLKFGYTRQTIHNYKTQLKKIGYGKGTLMDCKIDVPPIDYKRYYDVCAYNQDKIFFQRLLFLEDEILKFKKGLKYNC